MQSSLKAKRKPSHQARWFHARGQGWTTFSDEDDLKLENVWKKLGGETWDKRRRETTERMNSEQFVGDKDGRQTQDDRSAKSEVPSQNNSDAEAFEWLEGSRMPKRPSLLRPNTGVEKIKSALAEWVPESVTPSASGSSTPAQNGASRNGPPVFTKHLDPDTPEQERKAKVPVMEDNLFEVDLEEGLVSSSDEHVVQIRGRTILIPPKLYPVFWKGVMLRVVRANWFYSSSTSGDYAPIAYDEPLAQDLDSAYDKAQPWTMSEVGSTATQSADDKARGDNGAGNGEGEEKYSSFPLPSMSSNATVVFKSLSQGRIHTEDVKGRLLSILGGSIIVRGFDNAVTLAREKKRDYNPLNNISMPWADGHDSDSESDDKNDYEDRKAAEGQSHASRRAGKREGAAKVPKKPRAGGGMAGEQTEGSQIEQSFASRLWPSSDVLLRPGYQVLKAMGFSSEKASQEEDRRSREKATEESLKGEDKKASPKSRWASMFGLRGVEDSDESDSESDDGLMEEGDDGSAIEEDLSDSPPELLLCIHGIGQRLAQDFETLDFVYDVERLRNLSKRQAMDPTIRRLARGRRVQFLPICWRQSLDTDQPGDGSDNWYTLSDISNSGIPFFRNVISKVVLDVPIYMAPRHRDNMILAVRTELNRVYRLFVQRNPDFEAKGGRVSLVAHSLGSALASDILSAQPTHVPLVSELTDEQRRDNGHLLFNVKHLFLIGSPLGFFLYLGGSQLIARRGNARTKDVAEDAASDEVGREGCLAAEAIYNVLAPQDPVGYLLSPTVDASYASMLRPIPLPSATRSLLDSLALPHISVSKMFSAFGEHPFDGVGKIGTHALSAVGRNAERNGPGDWYGKVSQSDGKNAREKQSEDALEGDEIVNADQRSLVQVTAERGADTKKSQAKEILEKHRQKEEDGASSEDRSQDLKQKRFRWDDKHLEKAERRLRALNPHGCLDYTLVADGGVLASLFDNEYLLMLGAHTSYWTSRQFSTFLLTQLMLYGSDAAKDSSREIPTLVPPMTAPSTMSAGLRSGVELTTEDHGGVEGNNKQA